MNAAGSLINIITIPYEEHSYKYDENGYLALELTSILD
jgi:YD repeat-containing protein